MKEIIKERFKLAFEHLYSENHFKNKKAFAEVLDISPQFLSQLLNDKTPVPLELLKNFFQQYPVNPGFFFKDEDNILIDENAPSSSATTAQQLELEVAEVLMEFTQAHARVVQLIKKLQSTSIN